MARLTSVHNYTRKTKGKVYKVKGHRRRIRGLGKKIHYTPVGKFLVAHDELGNFRGSKIKLFKRSAKPITRKTVKPSLVKRKMFQPISKDKLDDDYLFGRIKYEDWIKKRKEIMGLP